MRTPLHPRTRFSARRAERARSRTKTRVLPSSVRSAVRLLCAPYAHAPLPSVRSLPAGSPARPAKTRTPYMHDVSTASHPPIAVARSVRTARLRLRSSSHSSTCDAVCSVRCTPPPAPSHRPSQHRLTCLPAEAPHMRMCSSRAPSPTTHAPPLGVCQPPLGACPPLSPQEVLLACRISP